MCLLVVVGILNCSRKSFTHSDSLIQWLFLYVTSIHIKWRTVSVFLSAMRTSLNHSLKRFAQKPFTQMDSEFVGKNYCELGYNTDHNKTKPIYFQQGTHNYSYFTCTQSLASASALLSLLMNWITVRSSDNVCAYTICVEALWVTTCWEKERSLGKVLSSWKICLCSHDKACAWRVWWSVCCVGGMWLKNYVCMPVYLCGAHA